MVFNINIIISFKIKQTAFILEYKDISVAKILST